MTVDYNGMQNSVCIGRETFLTAATRIIAAKTESKVQRLEHSPANVDLKHRQQYADGKMIYHRRQRDKTLCRVR